MNFRLHLLPPIIGVILSLSPLVRAQGQTSASGVSGMGADGAFGVAPTVDATESGRGVKMGDDTYLHLGVAAEAGYDTNVFYQDAANALSSPMVRVIPSLSLTNARRDGVIPAGVFYELGANLLYREYVSNDTNIKGQRSFSPTANAELQFSSGRTISVGISDTFTRSEDPPYGIPGVVSENITRNYNMGSAFIKLAPGGGRFQTTLRYSNTIDFFENADMRYANSIGHEGVLDASWRWLPKTALFIQGAAGMVQYPNKNAQTDPLLRKFNSTSVRAVGGLRGLITEKLSLSLSAGYATAFYETGATNPSGLSNLAGALEALYRPTLSSRVVLGYRHEFRNSIIGQYYDVDTPYLMIQYTIASRLNLGAFGKYELRRYVGASDSTGNPFDRRDNVVNAGAQADYFFQDWVFAGVSYVFTLNNTNVPVVNNAAGLNYVKHQVLGRVGIAY